MNKTLLAFPLSLIILSTAKPQWVQIGQVPTLQLNAVQFLDIQNGVTCGAGGIWRTANSGLNWTQVLVSNRVLNALSFSGLYGFVVGDSGTVFRSTNSGLTWSPISTGRDNDFNGVGTVSGNMAYIVGDSGMILKTTNAGSSWIVQTNYQWPYDLNAVMMLNASTGYAVGSYDHDTFMGTINGGSYWGNYLYVPGSLKSVFYVSTHNILAVGINGRIRRSTNGGASWTFPVSGTTQQLNSIKFPDSLTGFIAGNGGTLLKSTDAGLNWQTQSSGTSVNLRSLWLLNNSTGWIVGGNGIVIAQGIPVAVSPDRKKIPEQFKLYQNFPNPFNSTTAIKFDIPRKSYAVLKIFDALGKEIETLVDQQLNPGVYERQWNAQYFPSGIYLCALSITNIRQDNYRLAQIIILVR